MILLKDIKGNINVITHPAQKLNFQSGDIFLELNTQTLAIDEGKASAQKAYK